MRNAVLFALVCLLLAVAVTHPLTNAKNPIPDLNMEFGIISPPQRLATDPKVNPVSRVIVKTSVELTPQVMDMLCSYALNINFVFEKLNAVAMTVKTSMISKLQKLGIVEWVEMDCERQALGDYKSGYWTWNLDMINVAEYGTGYTSDYDGDGVYVAVLDTGLVKFWQDFFPEERIASEYAKAFLAASWEKDAHETPEVPGNAWERDTNSHGTHVTSTIIGYSFLGTPITGVAPLAKIIPVKVLHNSGFGWSSAIAKGIMYIADLKEQIGEPIVISMSLGGSVPSGIEELAINYSISKGVPVVAAAGNAGDAGMDWPGAYPQVISVGACGWTLEWIGDGVGGWWMDNVPEDLNTPDTSGNTFQGYITDFSGREMTDQDLDIVAPGSWVVGPYFPNGVSQPQGGYYYLGGTSMATPHVSGIVALMLQKNPTLTAPAIESILESSCVPILTTSAMIVNPFTGDLEEVTWGSDATGAGIIQADLTISNTPS